MLLRHQKVTTVTVILTNTLGLYLWIKAVKNYYQVYTDTTPKRDALLLAEKQLVEKERDIKVK